MNKKPAKVGAHRVHLTLTIHYDLLKFIKPNPLKAQYILEIITLQNKISIYFYLLPSSTAVY